MKKLIFTLILIFSFNAYAGINNCKYNLDIDNNNEIFTSLLEDKDYNYKNANGKICFSYDDSFVFALPLKNGRPIGPLEYELSSEGKKIMYFYISSYHLFKFFIDNQSFNQDDLSSIADIMKNDDIKMEFYHDNGNISSNIDLKKGIGTVVTYRENGSMEQFIPINNFKNNGIAEVYDEDGKLWSTITYKDDKIISAECADTIAARLRPGGLKWTKAEISNWENGLEVKCGP